MHKTRRLLTAFYPKFLHGALRCNFLFQRAGGPDPFSLSFSAIPPGRSNTYLESNNLGIGPADCSTSCGPSRCCSEEKERTFSPCISIRFEHPQNTTFSACDLFVRKGKLCTRARDPYSVANLKASTAWSSTWG